MYNKSLFTLIILFIVRSLQAQDLLNCFSIAAGKNATIDTTVLLAHNEDDFGVYVFNMYKVPALNHKQTEIINTDTDLKIPQISHTYSYIWVDMPELEFSDSYINEWGVAISSDQCTSREDKADLVDGGIGYYLRRLMVERAKTSREAVKIGGELVEKYGYNSSGRSYCIADQNEVWIMGIVKGRRWVAQRVPDDQVAVISNCYTIDKINLKDTFNFLGSKDIVSYAVSRGWYDPKIDKEFSFKYTYSAENSIDSPGNKPRQLSAINLISKNKFRLDENLPFSFVPEKKVTKEKLMEVLADHFENSDPVQFDPNVNPHFGTTSTVCSSGNQYGYVAQLRKNLPSRIANVLWLSIKRPCIQPFIPIYIGVAEFPYFFTYGDYSSALNSHFDKMNRQKTMDFCAFWDYKRLSDYVDNDYNNLLGFMKKYKANRQAEIFQKTKAFEILYMKSVGEDETFAIDLLQNHENDLLMSNLSNTRNLYKILK